MWNDRLVLVKEGQMITGRKELSEATGISEASIERILTTLENGQQIEQQKTTKYRLITIINWKDYQNVDSKVDNRRTTNGQQTDTNKNEENVKKDTFHLSDGNSEKEAPRVVYDEDEGGKTKKAPLPKIDDWVDIWNRYPNWKETGKKGSPNNPSVAKELLKPAVITRDIRASIIRKRGKYSTEEFERAVNKYAEEICNRRKDDKGFYAHRFTLYEFLTYKDIFERYVNR